LRASKATRVMLSREAKLAAAIPAAILAARAIVASAIVICLVLLAGCATAPALSRGNLLMIAGEGAAAYAVVPVRENRQLAERLLSSISPELAKPSSLDRVDCFYAAALPVGGLRAVVSGSFGSSLAAFAFSSTGGWTRRDEEGSTWYESASGAVSIPARGVLLFSSDPAGIRAMMASLKARSTFALGLSFEAWLGSPVSTGDIGILMNDPAPALRSFLGPEISIPATRMALYASRIAEEPVADDGIPAYDLSARLELSDKRASRGIAAMLRIAGARDVTVDAEAVSFSGMGVTGEKLAAMADNLYFSK